MAQATRHGLYGGPRGLMYGLLSAAEAATRIYSPAGTLVLSHTSPSIDDLSHTGPSIRNLSHTGPSISDIWGAR